MTKQYTIRSQLMGCKLKVLHRLCVDKLRGDANSLGNVAGWVVWKRWWTGTAFQAGGSCEVGANGSDGSRVDKPAVIKLLAGHLLGPGWGRMGLGIQPGCGGTTCRGLVAMEGKDAKHTKGNNVPGCLSCMGFLLSECHLFDHLCTSALSVMPVFMY